MDSYKQNVKDCEVMINQLSSKKLCNQIAAEAGWWKAVAKQYWNEIEQLRKDVKVLIEENLPL